MNRKIVFVINPSAGTKNKDHLGEMLEQQIAGSVLYEIINWTNKYQFREIREKLLCTDYTDMIAVGGDGTVNEVARVALEKNVNLGILPFGSGNGLARTLGLPMKIKPALDVIIRGNTKKIDVGTINDALFFCTAGVGFDAHIGHQFAQLKNRGFAGYVKTTCREMFSYRVKQYRLSFNNENICREAFLITFANAGQYGNDFYIAPEAKTDDGLLQVVILKPFPFYAIPFLLIKIALRRAHTSRYIETFTTNQLLCRRVEKGPIHFDGEPGEAGFEIVVGLKARVLNVITQ